MNGPDLLLLADIREAVRSGEARRVRQAARISRSEVAAVCGVDQSTVARWENDQRSPRGAAGLKYAQIVAQLRDAAGTKAAS